MADPLERPMTKTYEASDYTVRGSKGDFQQIQFREDLERDFGVPHGHPKAGALFALAWEYGHAYGVQEVASHYEEMKVLLEIPKGEG